MTLMEIQNYMVENEVNHVYIQSPRWNDEKVVGLSFTGIEELPYISVDSSVDEGVTGNTSDEAEYGNRMGKFLNSEEAILYDDFEILSDDDGILKFKKYRDIFEAKYFSNLEKRLDNIAKELKKWN